MSTLPANISRAPNLLFSQLALSNITRANVELFRIQSQLSTGRAINRPSDDPVKGTTIALLDQRIDRSNQRLSNFEHAGTNLGLIDASLGEAGDLVLQAKQVASDQVGLGSDADQRASQAVVVSSLLTGLLNLVNRQSSSGFLFGGSRTSSPPVEEFLGGFRYRGEGPGLFTDLGVGQSVPVTIGPDNALGATSARVRGSVDLNPQLTGDTRIVDLAGARSLGVTPGPVQFSFAGGPVATVDLSGADTIQDLADRLEASIRQYETDNSVTVLGPGGVSFQGGAISIDVDPAGGANPALEFFEIGTSVTARDLGLTGEPPTTFTAANPTGGDLQPRLTMLTPVSALGALTAPLGSIKVTNMGRSRVIDLSGAQTVQDIRNLIEGADLGIRVRINEQGTGIDVLNEVAGSKEQAMSIAEVSGSALTATRLGIRSLAGDTRLADFNDGRGVDFVTGSIDPITGLPDPSADVDFTITLGDGTRVDVDLRPQDMASVQTVLDRINAQAASQGVSVPGTFSAGLSDSANGIILSEDPSLGGAITVAPANNSPAAQMLGLLDGTFDPSSATLAGSDHARVRVDNVFTNLIDLRESLENDDTFGMTLAGEQLDASVSRIALNRGLFGGHAKRVQEASRRLEDLVIFDEQIRSKVRDVDFAEAASRFTLLQTQLTAALQSSTAINGRSLLDFLG